MANSADPDQLLLRSQLIWIYTVCKDRVYKGSAGLGLTLSLAYDWLSLFMATNMNGGENHRHMASNWQVFITCWGCLAAKSTNTMEAGEGIFHANKFKVFS